MNKNELAKQTNHKADLVRIFTSVHKIDFLEGATYDNLGNAESWSDDDSTMNFLPEVDGEYTYVIMCDNVPCYKVDYDNEEVTEMLNATGCESEGECLVATDTKMRVIRTATDDDNEEMGYYQITLEVIT